MAPTTRPLVCILGSSLVQNDSRLEKQRESLIARGYRVEMIGWRNTSDSNTNDMAGARILDTSPLRKVLQPLAQSAAYLTHRPSKSAKGIANAYARRISLAMDLMRLQPSAVVASDPETLEVAAWIKPRLDFKLIYDAHEYYPEEVLDDTARAMAVHRIHRRAADRIDNFITVNPLIAQLYANDYPRFPAAQILRNAPKAGNQPDYDGRLHKLLDLDPSTKIILHQGRLSSMRGLIPLALSACKLPSKWHVVFMGAGPLQEEIALAGGHRCSVIAPQPWEQLPLWTAGATIGAILYEPLGANQINCSPNKLWEFPAASVPILASPLPYLSQQVQRWGMGWVTEIEPPKITSLIFSLTNTDLTTARAQCSHFARSVSWEWEVETLLAAIS